jgi:hypothetical protein
MVLPALILVRGTGIEPVLLFVTAYSKFAHRVDTLSPRREQVVQPLLEFQVGHHTPDGVGDPQQRDW